MSETLGTQDVVVVPSPHVTLEDCRRAGYCRKGVKAFLDRHGLDFKVLLKEGYSVATVEATGDAMALRLVKMVREREEWASDKSIM